MKKPFVNANYKAKSNDPFLNLKGGNRFFNINFALVSRNRIIDIILSLNNSFSKKPLTSS